MEHPLRVDELPRTDNPPAVTAEPPPAPQAAPAPALPPLPNLSASDVLFLRPSDSQYKTYLPAANTRTQLSPALRAVCKTEHAVAVMIDWVQSNQLSFAVRCGGHSYEGFSQSTNVVIDLRGMAGITVDTEANLVTAGSGASLYQIYQAVAAQGLALQAGSCPTVGISGHILGGGHGLLARSLVLPAIVSIKSPWSTANRRSALRMRRRSPISTGPAGGAAAAVLASPPSSSCTSFR